MSLFLFLLLTVECWFFSLVCLSVFFFFFKQKPAYEMRISDWSSDVCSSDLFRLALRGGVVFRGVVFLFESAFFRQIAGGRCEQLGPGSLVVNVRHGVELVGGSGLGDRKSVV